MDTWYTSYNNYYCLLRWRLHLINILLLVLYYLMLFKNYNNSLNCLLVIHYFSDTYIITSRVTAAFNNFEKIAYCFIIILFLYVLHTILIKNSYNLILKISLKTIRITRSRTP